MRRKLPTPRHSTGITRAIGIFLLLATGFVPIHSTSAETTRCQVIESVPVVLNQSGAWCLNRNLYYAGKTGSAISINANGITLDLNGFQLTGNSDLDTEANGVRVYGFRSNVRITNGTVERFRAGIYSIGIAWNLHVDRMNLSQNRHYGIRNAGAARHTKIENTTILLTGGSTRPFVPTNSYPLFSAGISIGDNHAAHGPVISNTKVGDTYPIAGQPASRTTAYGIFISATGAIVQNSNIIFNPRSRLGGIAGIAFQLNWEGRNPDGMAINNVLHYNWELNPERKSTGILNAIDRNNLIVGYKFESD